MLLTVVVNILLGILPAVSLVVLQDILNQIQLNLNDMKRIIIMLIIYVSIDIFNPDIKGGQNNQQRAN